MFFLSFRFNSPFRIKFEIKNTNKTFLRISWMNVKFPTRSHYFPVELEWNSLDWYQQTSIPFVLISFLWCFVPQVLQRRHITHHLDIISTQSSNNQNKHRDSLVAKSTRKSNKKLKQRRIPYSGNALLLWFNKFSG